MRRLEPKIRPSMRRGETPVDEYLYLHYSIYSFSDLLFLVAFEYLGHKKEKSTEGAIHTISTILGLLLDLEKLPFKCMKSFNQSVFFHQTLPDSRPTNWHIQGQSFWQECLHL